MRSNTTRRARRASRRESLDQDRCGDVRRYVALQCVVTIDHSNWVVADLPQSFNYLNLKLARRRNAIHISYSVDEEELKFVSVAYLEPDVSAFVGVMCAAPQDKDSNHVFRIFTLRVANRLRIIEDTLYGFRMRTCQ